MIIYDSWNDFTAAPFTTEQVTILKCIDKKNGTTASWRGFVVYVDVFLMDEQYEPNSGGIVKGLCNLLTGNTPEDNIYVVIYPGRDEPKGKRLGFVSFKAKGMNRFKALSHHNAGSPRAGWGYSIAKMYVGPLASGQKGVNE